MKTGSLWSVGIFAEAATHDIASAPRNNVYVFNARKLRLRRRHVHTYADPFLFVQGDELYVLIEVQHAGANGYIHAWKTRDLIHWVDAGALLQEAHHCSHPYLFTDPVSQQLFLIPESSSIRKVSLYEFAAFPNTPEKRADLLTGNFVDSSVHYQEGTYYLSTFDQDRIQHRLFYADALVGPWIEHPANPVGASKAGSRNGGGFFQVDGHLYRGAQNMTRWYGEGVMLFEVLELSRTAYQEVLIVPDLKPATDYPWQARGRHHISTVDFQGQRIVALDGMQTDITINRAANLFFKIL